ncbi:MAG TPA: AraC family transcriptional regulator [Dongiaceae bacterium]|nr:AraC family transcriptional regulator [Dongiaceae bacterium]
MAGVGEDTPAASAGDAAVFQFSTESFPEQDRIAAWREVFGRTLLNIDISPRSREGFRARATMFRAPTLRVMRASTSPVDQSNPRGMITNDDLTFGWVLSKRWSASQLGRNADLTLGDGVLLSNGDVGGLSLPEPCRYVAFSLPRSALAPRVPDIGGLFVRGVPAATPALRMLLRYLDLAHEDHVAEDSALQGAFADHVCDLLALALGATRDAAEAARKRGLPAARLRAIQEDIRKSCGRADLSIHAVAAAHGVSARYVQRIFDETGSTFTQYLTEQRLAAAYKVLRRPASGGTPVSTIAYDCGFSDVSHFNRLFRRRFGCTPTEVRRSPRPPER